jgi:hypothetical protein
MIGRDSYPRNGSQLVRPTVPSRQAALHVPVTTGLDPAAQQYGLRCRGVSPVADRFAQCHRAGAARQHPVGSRAYGHAAHHQHVVALRSW